MILASIANRILVWQERRRKFKAALDYNRRHTFRIDGLGAGTWMCPTCCRIHHMTCSAKFSGPQFDACCGFPAGGRQDKKHATPQ